MTGWRRRGQEGMCRDRLERMQPVWDQLQKWRDSQGATNARTHCLSPCHATVYLCLESLGPEPACYSALAEEETQGPAGAEQDGADLNPSLGFLPWSSAVLYWKTKVAGPLVSSLAREWLVTALLIPATSPCMLTSPPTPPPSRTTPGPCSFSVIGLWLAAIAQG